MRYRFKGITWRATSGSPFKCVDIYRDTQEIRRNEWKLRMKRWRIKAHQRKCPLQRRYFKSKIRSQARYVQRLKKNLDFREGGSVHCCLSVSARFRYDFCCIPCSNKFVLIWSENVTHIHAGVKEAKIVIWRLHFSSYNSAERYFSFVDQVTNVIVLKL